jgi:hypothetical protein
MGGLVGLLKVHVGRKNVVVGHGVWLLFWVDGCLYFVVFEACKAGLK